MARFRRRSRGRRFLRGKRGRVYGYSSGRGGIRL